MEQPRMLTSLKASRSSLTPIMSAVSANILGPINSTKSSKSTLPPPGGHERESSWPDSFLKASILVADVICQLTAHNLFMAALACCIEMIHGGIGKVASLAIFISCNQYCSTILLLWLLFLTKSTMTKSRFNTEHVIHECIICIPCGTMRVCTHSLHLNRPSTPTYLRLLSPQNLLPFSPLPLFKIFLTSY